MMQEIDERTELLSKLDSRLLTYETDIQRNFNNIVLKMELGAFRNIMKEYDQKVRNIEIELNQQQNDIMSNSGMVHTKSPYTQNKIDLSQDAKLDSVEKGLKSWVISIEKIFCDFDETFDQKENSDFMDEFDINNFIGGFDSQINPAQSDKMSRSNFISTNKKH